MRRPYPKGWSLPGRLGGKDYFYSRKQSATDHRQPRPEGQQERGASSLLSFTRDATIRRVGRRGMENGPPHPAAAGGVQDRHFLHVTYTDGPAAVASPEKKKGGREAALGPARCFPGLTASRA